MKRIEKIHSILARVALFVTKILPFFMMFSIPITLLGQNYQDSTKLNIATYNIYMLPHRLVHTGQLKRAKLIAEVLKDKDIDIIVFEEAFDKTARKEIRDSLRKYYPYETGDPEKNKFWKLNSGVWIISKLPIQVIRKTYFNKSASFDRLACKGAIMIECQKNGTDFQLIGTHLQSDPVSGKNVQQIRQQQYQQIYDELICAYKKSDVPVIIAGDFNTIYQDSVCYNALVNTLHVDRYSVEGDNKYSYDSYYNGLVVEKNTRQLVDYVLCINECCLIGERRILKFNRKWDNKYDDLSDHFCVDATFSLNNRLVP